MTTTAIKIKIAVAILVWCSTAIDLVLALSADEKTQTKLSSNSAVCKRQNNENICTYSGNAKFYQGATSLQAEQISIYRNYSGNISKIVAAGEHSRYTTVVGDGQKSVNADANLITIYPDKKLMVPKPKRAQFQPDVVHHQKD